MNTTIKNAIGIVAALMLLVFGYAALQYVDAFDKSIEPSSFRSFNVSGVGEVVAVPDVAQFTFTVLTQGGNDIGSLQQQNTEKMNAAIAFVRGQGVEDKDIKTTQYSVEPRYQYYNCSRYSGEGEPCPPAEIVGYTIRQTASVKIRDFEQVGNMLEGVVENGANTVSQLSFTIDDPTEIENEAREQAIEKAREKAEAIADAAGFRVGRILEIQEGGSYPQPMYRAYGMADAAQESAKAPTIEPGSQEVRIGVSVTYEIN